MSQALKRINKIKTSMLLNYNSASKTDGLLGCVITALPVEMMNKKLEEALISSHGFATAATDGMRIFFSETFVNTLTDRELLFVLSHEVYHVVLDHINRQKAQGLNTMLYNMAGDYVINQYLKDNGVGDMPKQCLQDDKYRGKATEEVYKMLMDEHDKNVREGGEGLGDGSSQDTGNFDQHLSGKQIQEAQDSQPSAGSEGKTYEEMKARSDAMLEQVIEAGLKSAGDRAIGEASEWYAKLHEARIDWREELTAELSSLMDGDYGFNKVHRWSPSLGGACIPTPTPEPSITLSIAIDTSGSMGEQMLSDIFSEIVGITEQFNHFEVDVWCFDTKVHNFKSFDSQTNPEVPEYKLAGGGGTLFEVNWQFMKEKYEQPPKKFILLTDGYPCDSWGEPDYCDTIFLVHSSDNVAPFGKTITYYPDKM